jgi:hypothetical protein
MKLNILFLQIIYLLLLNISRMKTLCKGKTQKGLQCSYKCAKNSQYCLVHDPEKKSHRKIMKKEKREEDEGIELKSMNTYKNSNILTYPENMIVSTHTQNVKNENAVCLDNPLTEYNIPPTFTPNTQIDVSTDVSTDISTNVSTDVSTDISTDVSTDVSTDISTDVSHITSVKETKQVQPSYSISSINNDNEMVDLISKIICKNNSVHNELFIKCLKILKKYPPAKNEYKFIYGNLIQLSVIHMLNDIFYSCYDLDKTHTVGSEYKYDCILHITEDLHVRLSVKAKKNKTGNIIIINKLNNDVKYDLSNLITIIVIIELKDIIILPHNIIPNIYIEDNGANILYKSSLITYLYKTKDCERYIIHLTENELYKEFYKNEYSNIAIHDIYGELYSKL